MKTNLVLPKQIHLNHSAHVSNHAAHSVSTIASKSFAPNASGQACQCDRWGHLCSGCVNPEVSGGQQRTILAEETEG